MTDEYRYCPKCAAALAPREDGGRSRPACPTDGCGFVHYDNPVPVVAAIVERDDGVILARNHGWPEKWFGLVTGFLERDESPSEGILREVKEEIGLDGELGELVGVYPFAMRNQVIIAYHVRVRGEVVLGEELAAYKVVPVEKLRPWPMGTGDAVRDWLNRSGGTPPP